MRLSSSPASRRADSRRGWPSDRKNEAGSGGLVRVARQAQGLLTAVACRARLISKSRWRPLDPDGGSWSCSHAFTTLAGVVSDDRDVAALAVADQTTDRPPLRHPSARSDLGCQASTPLKRTPPDRRPAIRPHRQHHTTSPSGTGARAETTPGPTVVPKGTIRLTPKHRRQKPSTRRPMQDPG